MEAFMVGPVIIWFAWAFYSVKKKGRQWPDIAWGLVGGLILAKIMPDLPNTTFDVFDKIWNVIVTLFQSITP